MSPRLARALPRRAPRPASLGAVAASAASIPLSLALTLGLGGCASPPSSSRDAAGAPPQAAAADASARRRAAAADASTALVWVNGMGCPLCANNVDQQLKSVPGVENVTINLGTGLVQVALSSGATTTEAQLATAVHNTGFTLVGIQMPGAVSEALQDGATR